MSRKTAWVVLLFLVSCAGLVVPASAQHFQQVKGTLAGISAGRNEVFGFDLKSAVWRYRPGTQAFTKVPNISLVDIAVGGGAASQLDDVWGIDANGSVYRFNYTTNAFVQESGVLSQIVVGIGNQDNCHPYETWGINSADSIFRYDYCPGEFSAITVFLNQIATAESYTRALHNHVPILLRSPR